MKRSYLQRFRLFPVLIFSVFSVFSITAFFGVATGKAATSFSSCGKHKLSSAWRCGHVLVPLDWSGHVKGHVKLAVKFYHPHGVARPAIVGLAGGPGQAALPFAWDFRSEMGSGLKGRDLLVFDQRGSGQSGLLRCPSVEKTAFFAADVAACARRLGPRRAFYATENSVRDLEAIRAVLGIPSVMLYGTSYGTKLALMYAQLYPQRVSGLILDSVVGATGPDPWLRSNFQADPRVLNNLCPLIGLQASPLLDNTKNGCADFTQLPGNILAQLLKRLRHKSMVGKFFMPNGKAKRLRVLAADVFYLMYAGNFAPELRGATPAVINSAAHGDSAPLLRFIQAALYPSGPDAVSSNPEEFSNALYVATTCEDGPAPWTKHTSTRNRNNDLRRAARHFNLASFKPYDMNASLKAGMLSVCTKWPEAPRPEFTQSLPDVPAILLVGDNDTATPLSDARSVAAQLPRAKLVEIPATGHSVIEADDSGCASDMVGAWLQENPVVPSIQPVIPFGNDCVAAGFEPIQPVVVPPDSQEISDLVPLVGLPKRIGRVEVAVQRTLQDLKRQTWGTGLVSSGEIMLTHRIERYAGLRGGVAVVRDPQKTHNNMLHIKIRNFSYVSGVYLSGDIRLGDDSGQFFGKVQVRSTRVHGQLRFTHGGVHGRLNHTAVAAKLLPALLPEAADTEARALDRNKHKHVLPPLIHMRR